MIEKSIAIELITIGRDYRRYYYILSNIS